MATTTTDPEAPFGRTSTGKPFKTIAAAKRAATIAARGLPPSGRSAVSTDEADGMLLNATRGRHGLDNLLPKTNPVPATFSPDREDLLTRQRREISERMGDLAPLVDEARRLEAALAALDAV